MAQPKVSLGVLLGTVAALALVAGGLTWWGSLQAIDRQIAE